MFDENFVAGEDLYKSLSHRLLGFSRGSFASIEILTQQMGAGLREEANETLAVMRAGLVELERYREELDSIQVFDPNGVCDLRVIFRKLEFLFEKSLSSLCIDLVSNISHGSLPFVAGVPFRVAFLSLENILRNSVEALSDNSVEAFSTRGTISVDIEEREKQFLCRVTDDGPGIDACVLKDPFDQLATTKPGGGSGLHRTRGLLMQHGASIEVTMPGPDGTVLTLFFPKPE